MKALKVIYHPRNNANKFRNLQEIISESGTWTPALTFATPGNLSVAYTTQLGQYRKLDDLVSVWFWVVTSTFTHTTASGDVSISGLPFTVGHASMDWRGTVLWSGITKANYTHMVPYAVHGTTVIRMQASGSAQAVAQIGTADMPTGGTVILIGQVSYLEA